MKPTFKELRDEAEKHHQGMHGPSQFKKGWDACAQTILNDERVKNLLDDLKYLTACRCDEAYTKRNRHEPNSHCDYSDDTLTAFETLKAEMEAE